MAADCLIEGTGVQELDPARAVSMLMAADVGYFYRPPANIVELHPNFPVAENYSELKQLILDSFK